MQTGKWTGKFTQHCWGRKKPASHGNSQTETNKSRGRTWGHTEVFSSFLSKQESQRQAGSVTGTQSNGKCWGVLREGEEQAGSECVGNWSLFIDRVNGKQVWADWPDYSRGEWSGMWQSPRTSSESKTKWMRWTRKGRPWHGQLYRQAKCSHACDTEGSCSWLSIILKILLK